MKKYWFVFKASFQRALEYRARALVWVLIDVLTPTFLAFIFAAAVKPGQSLFGYSRADLVLYFLLFILFKSFVSSHFEEAMNDHVKNALISNYLLKPVNYFWYHLFSHMAWAVHRVLLSLLTFSVLLIVFNSLLGIKIQLRLEGRLLLLPLILFMSLLADYGYSFLLGLTSFWLIENFALYSAAGILVYISSGGLVPLDLMPKGMSAFLRFTPFPHLLYTPVKFSLGLVPFPLILESVLVLFFWILVFFFVIRRVWAAGLRRYEGVGL